MFDDVLAANEAFYDAHERRDLNAMSEVFITNVVAMGGPDVVWVTLDENLMQEAATGTVAATNVFIRTDLGWRIVLHHGSPVMGP